VVELEASAAGHWVDVVASSRANDKKNRVKRSSKKNLKVIKTAFTKRRIINIVCFQFKLLKTKGP